MSITSRNKKAETLAWITADEAEFWTSTSPIAKHNTSNNFPLINHNSSNVILSPDDSRIEPINEVDTTREDPLSLSYKEMIEKQAKEVSDKAKQHQLSDIFQSSGNNSHESMSFIDQLSNQSSIESTLDNKNSNDDVFEEIDENEKATLVNNNLDNDKFFGSINKLKDNIPFINGIRSFIDEVGEETNVLIGTMDEESFINQRSRKAKSSISPMKNNEALENRRSL